MSPRTTTQILGILNCYIVDSQGVGLEGKEG